MPSHKFKISLSNSSLLFVHIQYVHSRYRAFNSWFFRWNLIYIIPIFIEIIAFKVTRKSLFELSLYIFHINPMPLYWFERKLAYFYVPFWEWIEICIISPFITFMRNHSFFFGTELIINKANVVFKFWKLKMYLWTCVT